jgi:voltage-gated potassium channel
MEVAGPDDRASLAFDIFLISLISLNAVALIVGTVEQVNRLSPAAFDAFEAASVFAFTVEYALRVWCCTIDPRYSHPVWGRLRFLFSLLSMVDLLAILPFYFVTLWGLHDLDLRFFRAVRLLARVARLGRYSSGVRTLVQVLGDKRNELITVVLVLLVLLVMASSMMFFAESEAQPDKFANIPQAMWWSIITLTTVGYGDVFPITVGGRIVAGLIAIVGIGLFALPAGILGSGFLEQIQRRPPVTRICPHCGEEIHE